jgi:hypothetical protein
MVANPHDWMQQRYEFVNRKHPDLAVWTCNGLLFIKIGGNEGLSFAEKVAVLRAVKLTAARRLTQPNDNSAPPWGVCPEYRARRFARQSEKSYTKTAAWPLEGTSDRGQAGPVIGHGGAIWNSQGEAPA